jgi:DNA gyrase/topoisomerase IV subunit A
MTSKEYNDLKKEIDALQEIVGEQNETLKKIHTAIVGNKEFGQEGLVGLVKKHERWIESQKYMWAKIYGGIVAGSGIVTFILQYLLKN